MYYLAATCPGQGDGHRARPAREECPLHQARHQGLGRAPRSKMYFVLTLIMNTF